MNLAAFRAENREKHNVVSLSLDAGVDLADAVGCSMINFSLGRP